MLTGVATFKAIQDGGLFLYTLNEQCMALSMHLFYIRTQASGAPENLSYAIAATLLGVVLIVNATAIAFRAWLRSRKKW
jgi:ABC-type phosphate transport system permease subunit